MKFWKYSCLLVITVMSFNGDAYYEDDEREGKPSEASINSSVSDMKECTNKVNTLHRVLEEHRRKVVSSSQPPSCIPVINAFLTKLLEEMEKIGLPHNVTAEMVFDAEVKLSKQLVAEIRTLVNSESGWRTGALDDALTQISIKVKLHEEKTQESSFEDMFGVEFETVFKGLGIIFIIVVMVCTKMWSLVSWFLQFKRMIAILFFISLVWNWFYLYKIAFAEHQANIVKMENVNDKCTGLKKINWLDNFREWFRTTSTLQDDPCKRYYEILIVNPILLVPPTKAITMTITNSITDLLKHLGQGINEFFRALLKDLPLTLQILVLIVIALAIMAFFYSTRQAAVHHAVLRPLRGGHRDPLADIAQQPAPCPLQEPEEHQDEATEMLAGGDDNRGAEPRRRVGQEDNQVNNVRNRVHHQDNQPEIRQRRPNRRPERQRVCVETLRNADSLYSGDETDTRREAAVEDQTENVEEEPQNLSSDSLMEASASNTEITQAGSSEHNAASNTKDNKTSRNSEQNEVPGSGSVIQPKKKNAAKKEQGVENIGTPVQENMQE